MTTTQTATSQAAASNAPNGRMIIQATDVNHSYEGTTGWVNALRDFAIDIPENEFLCLLGPSGCGKSTFLKIVAGLMRPTEGRVLFGGKEITEPGLDRGIVFQEPALFPWLTVSRNVEFGLDMGGWSRQEARARGQHVLEIVGLGKVGNLYPYQLSGGMRHRVAVARAWALRDAPLLLMDEPFSAIDAINRMTLQDYLIETWLKEPRTVIYVTHDIDEAVYLGDRVAVMTPGPGKVGTYITIDLPRPRDRNSPEVARYKAEITEMMRQMTSR